ncbi:MAG: CdiI family contact-dependent growth inhibition immunity protein [Deltaproteobacteria bacterium]|nr:CdiI family contact-dependent growth inhibition immunity protein [Deltaproteobacteria bacterium]
MKAKVTPPTITRAMSAFVEGLCEDVAGQVELFIYDPPTLDDLFFRFAAAYTFRERIVVHGQAGWGGYYVAAPPHHGFPQEIKVSELGAAIVQALTAHNPAVPNDAVPSTAMKPVLRALGARSQKELQAEGKHCWIENNAHGIAITPTHNGGHRGDQRGFTPLEDRVICLSLAVSDALLGQALQDAFERCTS